MEPLADFDAGLMFADLTVRPGKDAEVQAALEKLEQQDPKRPEPYRGLGYIAWRAHRNDDAVELFRKAYDRGDREPRLLWDYGRLLESRYRDEAARVITELLLVDDRLEVRLELAELHLRDNRPKDALMTLNPIRSVTSAEAQRYARIAVTAHLLNGDQKTAEATALHFVELAKTDEDRAAAEALVRRATVRRPDLLVTRPSGGAPGTSSQDERPALRRTDTGADPDVILRREIHERPSVTGKFVELDCRGKQARMILQTGEGRKAFLIEDPERVVITAGSDGPVDMACGVQKKAPEVKIGYDPARRAMPASTAS